MQAICRPEILPLLRERIRQPRETAHAHADRQILAVYVAGATLRGIGFPHDWDLLRVRDIGRAVRALAFGILRVDLDELREVATVAQRRSDRGNVRLESIGADLKLLRRSRGPQP